MQNHSSLHIQGNDKTNHTKAMKKSCQLQKTEKAVLQQLYLAMTINNETLKLRKEKEGDTGEKVKEKEGGRT